MVKIDMDKSKGVATTEMKGKGFDLMIESIAIVHTLYNDMKQAGAEDIAEEFRNFLRHAVNDDTFWNLKHDAAVVIKKEVEEE